MIEAMSREETQVINKKWKDDDVTQTQGKTEQAGFLAEI